jgi:hypothetical protein
MMNGLQFIATVNYNFISYLTQPNSSKLISNGLTKEKGAAW